MEGQHHGYRRYNRRGIHVRYYNFHLNQHIDYILFNNYILNHHQHNINHYKHYFNNPYFINNKHYFNQHIDFNNDINNNTCNYSTSLPSPALRLPWKI